MTEKHIIQAAASVLLDAVLGALQEDPHQWSSRPCPTCLAITGIIKKPFGCYEYQRKQTERQKAAARGDG